MRAALFLVFLIFFLTGAIPAQALELDGALTQGGLVVGRAAPGAQVAIEGRKVRVSKDGFFLMGFGRDAPAKVKLVVTRPDGGVQSRVLEVAGREYEIQRIDGLPKRQVTPNPKALLRIKADNAKIGAVRRLDTDRAYFVSGFAWPVRGRISGVYGSQRILNGKPKRPHNGVDIAAPRGEPVKAAADGAVALAHPDMFYTGKTMLIDHGHGLTSVYAHMSEILVAQGQWVAKGQVIGKVGASGRATGPHLHWGVTLKKTHLDPALLAGKMGGQY